VIDALKKQAAESGGQLSAADAKKLETAISEKQETEAKLSRAENKLKLMEEAYNELKQKSPNDVVEKIEALLQKKMAETTTSAPPPPPPPPMNGNIPPPPPPPPFMGGSVPPPPPPPPFMGTGGAPPPPPPPPFMGGPGGPPPPPPPPMMGGPPPPPPPFGAVRAPPPAPSLPFGMKEKPKYKVDAPLKKINWDKIAINNLKENAFWVKVDEQKYANDKVCKLLVDNFSTKKQTSKYEAILLYTTASLLQNYSN
jgi:diaphanous 2